MQVTFSQLRESDIYLIDYAGTITLTEGLINIARIESEIRRISIGKDCVKLIVDFRNAVWESREIHDELSRIARRTFSVENMGLVMYAAVLHRELEGDDLGSERWFTDEMEAIKWLSKKAQISRTV
jgi:hypothetical protein